MTGADWIAAVLGAIATAMVIASQHGIGTRNTTPQHKTDGDPST